MLAPCRSAANLSLRRAVKSSIERFLRKRVGIWTIRIRGTLLPLTTALGSRNQTGDSRVHGVTFHEYASLSSIQGRISPCSAQLSRKPQRWHHSRYSSRCWRCGYRCFQRSSVLCVRKVDVGGQPAPIHSDARTCGNLIPGNAAGANWALAKRPQISGSTKPS